MKKNKRSSSELGIKIITGALTVEKISDLEYRISAIGDRVEISGGSCGSAWDNLAY